MIIDSLIYNGMCSCGKEHKMKTDFCIIESGCLKDIKKYRGYIPLIFEEQKIIKDRMPKHPIFYFKFSEILSQYF